MSEQTPFQLDFVEQGRVVLVRVQGALDESNVLAERTPPFTHRKLVVNLERVHRMNAFGLRDWIRWTQAQEAAGNSLHLVRCSVAVMAQLKGVQNGCGRGGHLISFFAPYHCPPCGAERDEPILTSMLRESGPPPSLCLGCGDGMAFDDALESYQHLLKEHAQRPIDQDVATALHRLGDVQLATAVATLQEISSGRLSSPSRYFTPSPSGIGKASGD